MGQQRLLDVLGKVHILQYAFLTWMLYGKCWSNERQAEARSVPVTAVERPTDAVTGRGETAQTREV